MRWRVPAEARSPRPSSATTRSSSAGPRLPWDSTHGRLLLVDPSIGESHAGHGIVLPSCTHGGPGRAGGGEELGGVRGLWLYHQRVAVQTSRAIIGGLKSRGYNARP